MIPTVKTEVLVRYVCSLDPANGAELVYEEREVEVLSVSFVDGGCMRIRYEADMYGTGDMETQTPKVSSKAFLEKYDLVVK